MPKNGYISGGMGLLTQRVDNQKKNKYWTLLYIKDGIGMYLLDDSLRCLNKGDMILLPPKVNHSFSADDLGDEYNENITARVMMFDEDWLDSLLGVFPVMSPTVLRIKEQKNPMVVTGPKWIRIASLLDECSDSPVKVMDLIEQISTYTDMYPIMEMSASSEELTVSQKKEMIDRYISCNLCNKVTLSDVSSYVGMSRIYFCQFFKTHYKEGFADYLNRKRTEKACVILSQSEKPMSAVAAECGFKTVPYFTRVFTGMTGITPAKYRKTTKSTGLSKSQM